MTDLERARIRNVNSASELFEFGETMGWYTSFCYTPEPSRPNLRYRAQLGPWIVYRATRPALFRALVAKALEEDTQR